MSCTPASDAGSNNGEQRRMKYREVFAVRAAKVLSKPNNRNHLITLHLAYSVLKVLGVAADVLEALSTLASSDARKVSESYLPLSRFDLCVGLEILEP